jgi:cyclopropane fatty-acyl-phospholipid synthase-like methyltransferase
MDREIINQKRFWDKEAYDFDSIYSGQKSRIAHWLDSVFRWDMYERFNFTMKKAQPIQGRTFLDVGCGSGRYAMEFARRKARKVVGLDISSKMIDICQQRTLNENLSDRVSFIQSDILQYKTDLIFDVVIAIGLFDYIKDPSILLNRMRECIDDKAIMSFPRAWTWRALIRKVRLKLKKVDVYFYTESEIRDLLKKAGFKHCSLETIGQLHCVTSFVKEVPCNGSVHN